MKRRTLVKAIGTAGIAASFPFHALGVTGEKKMKVLFMGGTGFIGPHMVRALINAGHDVTLFNRGKTNSHLFQPRKIVIFNCFPAVSTSVCVIRSEYFDL